MRRLAGALLLLCLMASAAHAAAAWDPTSEISRLYASVPSLAAFHGARGIVWLESRDYSISADGSRVKRYRKLMILERDADTSLWEMVVPVPMSDGARVEFECASWHDPSSGRPLGNIPIEMCDDDGLRYAVASIPRGAAGSVIALSYAEICPMESSIGDVVELAGPLPIWEEHVRVYIPSGSDVYWDGAGVLSPHRERGKDGRERIEWTAMNQEPFVPSRLVATRPPTLVFSMERGIAPLLKTMSIREAKLRVPPVPPQASRHGGDLAKFGASAVDVLTKPDGAPRKELERLVRQGGMPQDADKLTAWERTLAAGKWFALQGHGVEVFWKLAYPSGANGPSAEALLETPVIKIAQSGDKEDIYFFAGQTCAFGRTDPSLAGQLLFRSDGGEIVRIMVPKGNPTENQIKQTWRMTIEEDGTASGKLDLDISGAWLDVFDLRREASAEQALGSIERVLAMDLPALELSPPVIKRTSSGVRASLDVRARLGISSGSEILLRVPGAAPRELELIPDDGSAFDFRFPFIFEIDPVVTTPAGYRIIMLPQKVQSKSPSSSLDVSLVHWPKRRRAEAEFKWVVRNSSISVDHAKHALEQARQVRMWSSSPIALRK